jgi:hypothetical protein
LHHHRIAIEENRILLGATCLHSGGKRAVQTANIFHTAFGHSIQSRADGHILPYADRCGLQA